MKPLRKIVVAADSFKGSLSSVEVAGSVTSAIREVLPGCEVVEVPVADGGEGTVDALVAAMNGSIVSCTVHDPLMRPVIADYGILGDGQTAVMEMASASGLTLLSSSERNPMITTTFGTGELIKDALEKGCTKFLIGIGGSATNDAGTGMLQALGYRFLNREDEELVAIGATLKDIDKIDCTNVLPQVKNVHFIVACDVNNPFSGEHGAACVFAPQKGADAEMVRALDAGMKHFSDVIKEQTGENVDQTPGAGAAGGMGGAFLAFLDAELKSGVRMILDALNFEQVVCGADLIITGEGKLDRQTMMGKTPAGVLDVARRQGIPVIAIGGSVEDADLLNDYGFQAVFPLLPAPVSLEKAMEKEYATGNIRRTIKQIMRLYL